MAERYVRTTEGARIFGVPIGTKIQDRTSPEVERTVRPMTSVRLASLQRQFEIAKKTGNVSEMKNIQARFTAAVKDFSSTRQLIDGLKDLVASRGRADQAINAKTTHED